ncbi:MAG: ribose-phosphate pyrophosphokinase [Lachnospiraceae bacterium]|nr:ribose-phosphate pyrophosphokinase [Lachnospiraceae bacterium]MBR3262875.1 ribose-phosphate pyrophosphokinase [Lachnospiraceae bacterium]MBR6356570.1 ribose-phosphate pyrophosphokinase [Lachnospiraceae bacterium]MBR7076186.1 ribose-phosphate pyrophosphokinase [Lachnospiraceae bacterium]
MLREEIEFESIPVGPLGIIPLKSCVEMGNKIDYYITTWRKNRESELKGTIAFSGYEKDTFLVGADTPRFGSGESKGLIKETIRGKDIFLLVDVCNNSLEYKMAGIPNRMSPDDHFQDLKRIIAAIGGKARRITVIMPFLYESRQHKRTGRESLDCALGLRELYDMGVDNLITFDAHDPRVINAAPLNGFENIKPSYQFLKNLCKYEKDLKFDKDHLVMISPDEGAIDRSVYFASVLGIDMGMFYKRRDYSQVVDGVNPIVAHEYLGTDLAGKDVIVVDDMISSGGSMIDTAKDLKDRGANRVFIFATFGLFTNGMSKFDEAYEKGLFTRVLTTNLTYQNPELLSREYYTSVDMSKYISYIIDTLNHDASISDLLDPSSKIKSLVERYEAGQLSADDIDKME